MGYHSELTDGPSQAAPRYEEGVDLAERSLSTALDDLEKHLAEQRELSEALMSRLEPFLRPGSDMVDARGINEAAAKLATETRSEVHQRIVSITSRVRDRSREMRDTLQRLDF